MDGSDDDSNDDGDRSDAEKHAEVVEYLKELPVNEKATINEIYDNLEIDLSYDDLRVMEMLRSNPRVLVEVTPSEIADEVTLQYVRPYTIKDKNELIEKVKKVRNGILFSDIENCYEGIAEDCKELIVGGDEVLACKNTEKKTFVLYPRGIAFYTRLSGVITAEVGKRQVRTTEPLMNEIRRGDAICIGGSWYRVSCSVGRGTEREQSQRSTAPLSVTSDKEMSDKNVYFEAYTKDRLPLDGEFEAISTSQASITERAKRHGCTNDVRKLWHDSLSAPKRLRDDEEIEQELITLGLIKTAQLNESNKALASLAAAAQTDKKPSKKRYFRRK